MTFAPQIALLLISQITGDLHAWFAHPYEGTDTGTIAAKAALFQLKTPYLDPISNDPNEILRIDLEHFQCVSLVENSLAVARCAVRGEKTETCFTEEVQKSRYRNGVINDYASRLHYFSEWLDNNAERGRIEIITEKLGGTPRTFDVSYMSKHARKYPLLADSQLLTKIIATETELKERRYFVIDRQKVASIDSQLQDGDIIAVVTTIPGIVISHVGFVKRAQGKAHLLHASSYHKKVILTPDPLSAYLLRRADRQGIMVARPLMPPKETTQASTNTPQ